jgi:hypothetical protein
MTGDIKSLPTLKAKANEEAIKLLEDMMVMAKEGKINGITVVADLDEGGWVFEQSSIVDLSRHLGQLHHAAFTLSMRIETGRTEVDK